MKKSIKANKTKMFNRFGLTGLAAALVTAPTLVAAGCGGSSTDDVVVINNDGISTWQPKSVATDLWGINSATGSRTDKSFNNQTFDVVKAFTSLETRFLDGENVSLPARYANALAGEGRLQAASGFDHIGPLTNKVEGGGAGIGDFGDTRWILIDGEVPSGYVASVTFKSEQAAFIAGFLSAAKARDLDGNDPVVATYGGIAFPTVTSFMAGFQQGVKEYNAYLLKNKPTAKKVKFYVPSPAFIGTFDSAPSILASNITSMFNSAGVDIILPVAGSQAATVAGYIKNNVDWQGKKMIVGVDTDLKSLLTDPIQQAAVYTSVQKNIATVLTAIINNIYSTSVATPAGYLPVTQKTTDLLNAVKAEPSKFKGQENTFFGRTINGGYLENFVSLSGEAALFTELVTLFAKPELNITFTAADKEALQAKAALASPIFDKDLVV